MGHSFRRPKPFLQLAPNSLIACCLLTAFCFLTTAPCIGAIAPVETTTLPNGSTLLVRRDKISPRVAISLLVRVGAAEETAENAGWRQVLAAALLRSTRLDGGAVAAEVKEGEPASAETFVRLSDWQRRVENWGGNLGATVDDDSIEFWITGDSAHTRELMQTLLQIVLHPRLADEDFVAARRRVLALQSRTDRGVASRATQSIARQLYVDDKGQPLAYALPTFGTFESLSSLTNEQLQQWHAQYFVAPRLIVAAAGDVNPEVLSAEISRAATAPEKTPAPAETLDKAPAFGALDANRPPLVVREMGVGGAWVFASFRAPGATFVSPGESAALQVLSAALEGSSQARLPRRLLGDLNKPFDPNAGSNSLAAQTAAQWTSRRWAGELTVFAQTGPQNVESVKNALLDEIRKLRETPLSAAELHSAKLFARGEWAVKRERLRERAFEAAVASLHATTPDSRRPEFLQAVSAADVQRVAQKYLSVYTVVLIMPQE